MSLKLAAWSLSGRRKKIHDEINMNMIMMIMIDNNYDDNDMILVITICDDNNDSMTLCWCYKVSYIQPSSQ